MSRPILIVDDDPDICSFVGEVLADEGYAIATAGDGLSALETASGRSPQLILLDMRMPGMDGWTFAKTYRAQPGPHAPIVVMTAARNAAERADEIQAEGFLSKPFDLNDLLEVVGRLSTQI